MMVFVDRAAYDAQSQSLVCLTVLVYPTIRIQTANVNCVLKHLNAGCDYSRSLKTRPV